MNWIRDSLASSRKIFGIFGLLAAICLFTAWQAPESFLLAQNLKNTIRWTALYGIIGIGVSFVIMTGGIDLSIGSVIGLVGCLFAMALNTTYEPAESYRVSSVSPSTGTLQLESSDGGFAAGDRIFFLNNQYEIASADDGTVRLATDVKTGSQVGVVRPIARIIELGGEEEEGMRRGMTRMRIRRLLVDGEHPDLKPEDRVELLYELGSPQSFTVHNVTVQEGRTAIELLVLPGARLREPSAAMLLYRTQAFPTSVAIVLVLGFSLLIGLSHGLLITKLNLQPFVVTLCGLLVYRGVARYITADQEQGFGGEYPELKQWAKGDLFNLLSGDQYVFDIPMPFVYMLILALVASVFLNKTIFGRYILALGRSVDAARYSGIRTDRMIIITYVISSLCAGLAGILFALDVNSVQPASHGSFYELYAIAAAVLGGCSLRGGEGTIIGVVIAAAVLQVLKNAINLVEGVDVTLEFAIIGFVILAGAIVDEMVRRVAAWRRATKAA